MIVLPEPFSAAGVRVTARDALSAKRDLSPKPFMKRNYFYSTRILFLLSVIFSLAAGIAAQNALTEPAAASKNEAQAEAVLQKAIKNLGGEKYLNVKTQIGRGKYSIIKDGTVVSFQTFTDVIVYPDKERTDFKGGGSKSVQTNVANTGWVYDGDQELVKVQDEKQVENFKRGMRTSLDYLLRGHWRGEGELAYVGKRPATLGKRNEVVKLTYEDGLVVEFEFAADDGLPQKGSYKRLNADNEEIKEEDRYAQFIDVDGIKAPFIIDRFTGGKQSSRINYQTVEYNKSVPDSIFTKPANAKELKDLKL